MIRTRSRTRIHRDGSYAECSTSHDDPNRPVSARVSFTGSPLPIGVVEANESGELQEVDGVGHDGGAKESSIFARAPPAYGRGGGLLRFSRRLRVLAGTERRAEHRRAAPEQSPGGRRRAGRRTARRCAQTLPLARGPLRQRPGARARARLRRISERRLRRCRAVFPASRGSGVGYPGDAGGGSAWRRPHRARPEPDASGAAALSERRDVRTGHPVVGLGCERTRGRRHTAWRLRARRNALYGSAPAFDGASPHRRKPRAHADRGRADRRCHPRIQEAPPDLLGRRRRSRALAPRRGIAPEPAPASPRGSIGGGAGYAAGGLRRSVRRRIAAGRARYLTACAARPGTATDGAGRPGSRTAAPASRTEPDHAPARALPGAGAADRGHPAFRGNCASGTFEGHSPSRPLGRSRGPDARRERHRPGARTRRRRPAVRGTGACAGAPGLRNHRGAHPGRPLGRIRHCPIALGFRAGSACRRDPRPLLSADVRPHPRAEPETAPRPRRIIGAGRLSGDRGRAAARAERGLRHREGRGTHFRRGAGRQRTGSTSGSYRSRWISSRCVRCWPASPTSAGWVRGA